MVYPATRAPRWWPRWPPRRRGASRGHLGQVRPAPRQEWAWGVIDGGGKPLARQQQGMRVTGHRPRHDIEHRGASSRDRAGDGELAPVGIERLGQRRRSHSPMGRLQAHEPTGAGRDADGLGRRRCVRTGPCRRNGCCRAAGGSPRRIRLVSQGSRSAQRPSAPVVAWLSSSGVSRPGPRSTNPARRSLATNSMSNGARQSASRNVRIPRQSGSPAAMAESFNRMGTPWNGPGSRSWLDARARARSK